MHVHENLSERGLWERSEIEIVTVQPILMPNAGGEGSEWIAGKLAERGIGYRTGVKVERVEAGRVVLGDGEVAFDLLVGVPPHRVPEVVKESGLLGESGWVKVNKGTFETDYPGVFAIGDVTAVKLANGLPLPKAGIIAELEGERVAAAIAAAVQGEGAPPAFDGHGFCFFEMGTKEAALIEGEFYAEPAPRVTLAEPDAVHAEEKRRFESERLERWFGGQP
jgi:sulfide:quinone oxidoreductase